MATGTEKKIKVKKWKPCDTCHGSGARGGHSTITCPACNGAGEIRQVSRSVFGQFVNIATCQNCEGEGKVVKDPCPACKGDGRIQGESTIKVNIPAGVSEGNYIPSAWRRERGPPRGPCGRSDRPDRRGTASRCSPVRATTSFWTFSSHSPKRHSARTSRCRRSPAGHA